MTLPSKRCLCLSRCSITGALCGACFARRSPPRRLTLRDFVAVRRATERVAVERTRTRSLANSPTNAQTVARLVDSLGSRSMPQTVGDSAVVIVVRRRLSFVVGRASQKALISDIGAARLASSWSVAPRQPSAAARLKRPSCSQHVVGASSSDGLALDDQSTIHYWVHRRVANGPCRRRLCCANRRPFARIWSECDLSSLVVVSSILTKRPPQRSLLIGGTHAMTRVEARVCGACPVSIRRGD